MKDVPDLAREGLARPAFEGDAQALHQALLERLFFIPPTLFGRIGPYGAAAAGDGAMAAGLFGV
jgi:hypothetical protein